MRVAAKYENNSFDNSETATFKNKATLVLEASPLTCGLFFIIIYLYLHRLLLLQVVKSIHVEIRRASSVLIGRSRGAETIRSGLDLHGSHVGLFIGY